MTQPAKSHEPSMEEILASIRRIIADDDGAKSEASAAVQADPPPPPAPSPEPAELPPVALVRELEPVVMPPPPADTDILELTDDMRTSEPEPQFRTISSEPDVMFAEPEPEPEPQPEPEPAAQYSVPTPDPLPEAHPLHTEPVDRPLLSSSASAAVDTAFASLAHTVLTHNARTLDDLVKDMLRPMLKAWLDDNLPGLVERLVRAEIERVSRGR